MFSFNANMVMVLHTVLVCFAGYVISQEIKEQKFVREPNGFCSGYHVSNVKTMTKMICAERCLITQHCLGFCFNDKTKKCSVYAFVFFHENAFIFNFRTYVCLNVNKTMGNGVKMCESNGASLMLPQSDKESKIYQYIKIPAGKAVMGANDQDDEGTFVRTEDGAELRYFNWKDDQPDNGNYLWQEDCVVMYPNGKWNDDPCTVVGEVCCQHPGPSVCSTVPQGNKPVDEKCFRVVT